MKNNSKFLLLFIILNFSCSTDNIQEEIIIEEPIRNKIEFKVNNLEPLNEIRNLTATFCCGNSISVSFDHWVSTSNGLGYGGSAFSLRLDENGNLLGLSYKDYTHPNNEYYSPIFNPTSTLNVTDFEFVENQILKLKINGQIFKKTYNFFAEPDFVDIKAEIEIKEFHKCICSFYSSRLITNSDFVFGFVSRSHIGNNQEIRYSSFSNNGYHLEFINFTEFIKDMSPGVYYFDEGTTSHRIDFRKFIGVPRFFSSSIIPQEWLKYETSGSFEILEKQQIGNEQVSIVKFNLLAKNNNDVVFEFADAILQTTW
jgi:hypothetical protein